MQDLKKIKSTFVRQQDQSDCGVACLATLIKYYGGHVKLERLREISGTDSRGTTLLGLCQAGPEIGLDTEGYEADIKNLKEIKEPCILNVLIDNQLMHYVVCYGYKDEKFLIGDPAKGILEFTPDDLDEIWRSKALLTVKPNHNFIQQKAIKYDKWRWFQKLITEDYNVLGIALVLGIFITFMSMATAIFSQKLIDEILPDNNHLKLTVGLSLLAFLLLMRSGISVLRENFVLRQSISFNKRVINNFYSALLKLPKSFFDNRKTGELIARMNDTIRIQNSISYMAGN
ncbi:MAG: peptidase domain-containing ABC transporter, partial [Bacteroidia bacterium]|nr:peptidase domain-containing ABC transporter [Bacteroidia bacterium]